jgi:hypothetical protein
LEKIMKSILIFWISLLTSLVLVQEMTAQSPGNKTTPQPNRIVPDQRVQQRTYHFDETNEELPYVLFVSSKVAKVNKSPLIVALHGSGGDGNFLVRERLVDLAEEGGFIVAGPLGYTVTGWFGVPRNLFIKPPEGPNNLPELMACRTCSGFFLSIPKQTEITDSRDCLFWIYGG